MRPEEGRVRVSVDHLAADAGELGAHALHLLHHRAEVKVGKVPMEGALLDLFAERRLENIDELRE